MKNDIKDITLGTKVKGTDFYGDTYTGIVCKIKTQELGCDRQGFEVDKLKFYIEGVQGVRFNYEDLEILD